MTMPIQAMPQSRTRRQAARLRHRQAQRLVQRLGQVLRCSRAPLRSLRETQDEYGTYVLRTHGSAHRHQCRSPSRRLCLSLDNPIDGIGPFRHRIVESLAYTYEISIIMLHEEH